MYNPRYCPLVAAGYNRAMRILVLLALLLWAVSPLDGSAQTGSACHLYDSGIPAPTRFGAAWSTLTSSRELFLRSNCSGNSAQTCATSAGPNAPEPAMMSTSGGGSGGANYFLAKNSFDMPIPAGHPILKPRPSSMVAGAICTSADYIADMKIGWPKGIAVTAGSGDKGYGYPIYQSTADDPLKTVDCAKKVKKRGSKCEKIVQARGWDKIRIPNNAIPQEEYDYHITVLDHSGKFLTDFYGMRRTVGINGEVSWRADSIARFERSGTGYWPSGTLDLPYVKLCQASNYHGLIKYDEITKHKEIRHALIMDYPYPASDLVKGVSHSFYPCEHPYSHWKAELAPRKCMLPLGIRLQFDPKADPVKECAGVDSRYRGSCVVIVKAMQKYGIILTDGSPVTQVHAENVAHKPHSWADHASEGYALPTNGIAALKGVDFFGNLRAVEPVRP